MTLHCSVSGINTKHKQMLQKDKTFIKLIVSTKVGPTCTCTGNCQPSHWPPFVKIGHGGVVGVFCLTILGNEATVSQEHMNH